MARPRLSLGSVAILVATLALCLAPVRSAPGLSGLLALILIPTALRAAFAIERRRSSGRRLSFQELHDAYLYAFIVTLTIIPAAVVAFVATCVPVGLASGVQLMSAQEPPSPSPLAIAITSGMAASGIVMLATLGRRAEIEDKTP
jgi:hypothetical protein